MSPSPHKLPYKTFLGTFKLVPRLAISLVITHDHQFLLAKRVHSPLLGQWHLPGSFLLKNESLEACINRITTKELNFDASSYHKQLLGVFENTDHDPRGHIVDLVYQIKLDQAAATRVQLNQSAIAFFDRLPASVGFNHDHILRQLNLA
jgi:ADP-ribose pyrophosphatase YjhB (NUDIX family)